ncbi:MAG: type II toxin-antitoxin system VapC family toxin [Gammaproteobacteria bacterium]
MKALFDTNILIDYLNGLTSAKTIFNKFETNFISIISWMEVLIGFNDDSEMMIVKDFLQQFNVIHIDFAVAKIAIKLRQQHKIKLPDAIIWASAEANDCLLVTRNTKDFPENIPTVWVPYKL